MLHIDAIIFESSYALCARQLCKKPSSFHEVLDSMNNVLGFTFNQCPDCELLTMRLTPIHHSPAFQALIKEVPPLRITLNGDTVTVL